MSDAGKAVFLSYASQDAEAAKRICEALRQAGIEVWFDQSELRGGDAWDALIRKRIKECTLFVPLITPTTNARAEGYFRLEWKLAVDRSHLMADDAPFLFPIVLGDVTDATARVPDKFREVQWTRLRLDETPGELAARVARLLRGAQAMEAGERRPEAGSKRPGDKHERPAWLRYGFAVFGMTIALVAVLKPGWRSREEKLPASSPPSPAAPAAPAVDTEARRLARQARALIDQLDSTPDDYAAAEGLVKRALELDPNDGEVLAISSLVNSLYLSRGFDRNEARREAARSQAERAVKLAPDSPDAWLAVGRGVAVADAARAEQALHRGLDLAPRDGRLLIALGSLYRRQGRFAEALATYEQAAALPESRALARYDQYLIHFYQRRFADADRCIRDGLTVAPTVNMIAGLALLEVTWRGRVPEALEVLAAAPSGLRGQPRLVVATVLVNLMARRPEAALKALDQVPADYINDAWFTGPKALLAGLAHVQAGRSEAARLAWEAGLTVVRRRLQETPNDEEQHTRLGELLAWSGQTEAALHEAQIVEELNRRGVGMWTDSSVRIHAALGRADSAVPRLKQMLKAADSGRWPLTPALLRIDPLWDKIRSAPDFQALTAEGVADQGPAPVPPAIDAKSVAVLAFANLSDDKSNEYFSDGISEELLNVLAKVPGLKVSARTSAFYFKGKEVPVPEIAKQLGVAYVVEGSVRKAGDKVRITAQLIKAADGFHVWSETFTRDLKDIFAVQDEIAGLIAKNLELKIGTRSAGPAAPVNPEVFELYVQARRAWNLRNAAGFAQAEELLTRALTLEPNFARAHVALADVWTLRAIANGVIETYGQRSAPVFTQIVGEIEKALALDPDSNEARASLSLIVRFREWDLDGAERELRRAIELNPNYATAHHWLGNCLSESGRIEEGLVEARRAAELDPFSLRILENYAKDLVRAGHQEEALAVLGRAEALSARAPLTLLTKAEALLQLGRRAEAIAVARELGDTDRAVMLAKAGVKGEAEAALGEAEGWFRYQLLVALGRTAEAVAALRADDMPASDVANWLMDSRLDPFRQDPHFVELLKTLGLTEAHARAQAWRAAQPPAKP